MLIRNILKIALKTYILIIIMMLLTISASEASVSFFIGTDTTPVGPGYYGPTYGSAFV